MRCAMSDASNANPGAAAASSSSLAIPYSPLYAKSMTREPLPRYITTVHLTVELSAKDEAEADHRLDRIVDEIQARLRKTTFQRLPGRPEVTYADWDDADLH